ELARDVEQLRLIPALELELDFAQRRRAGAGIDPALIDRERDSARAVGQGVNGSRHPGFEHRLELPAELGADQWLERGAVGQAQIGLLARDFALPFVALEQPSIACRLDGLDVAVSGVAHPQHQALLAERVLVGVEIDGDLGRALGRRLEGANERDFLQPWQACRRKLELYLDFLWRRHKRIRTRIFGSPMTNGVPASMVQIAIKLELAPAS